ncbi:unnamed protein product, partial [marine sediment metagenome]
RLKIGISNIFTIKSDHVQIKAGADIITVAGYNYKRDLCNLHT